MGGWPVNMQQSNDRTTGGRSMPPYNGHCAKCLRRRPVGEMTIEANERSGAFGFYVCGESSMDGGCYDGPYPNDTPDTRPDDLSPVPNLLHI